MSSSAQFDRRTRCHSNRPGKLGLRLLGLLVLGGALAVFVPRAGALLVVEDSFQSAELAVVLSGGPVPRALAAADLFKQRRVERILVIPEPPDPARPELVRLGLVDAGEPPISARILAASGVPKDRITFLPEPADGTITEAQRVREFLRDRRPASLVIVTSKFATRRARFIFSHILGADNIQVLAYPSRLDPFEPRRWWAQPRNALTVVMEYQKLVSNALTLAARPVLGRLRSWGPRSPSATTAPVVGL
jgi:uncharacterized SAM-binding protein YcdF (DUF218 family)